MRAPRFVVRVATDPADQVGIAQIDTSFHTSRVYGVHRAGLGYALSIEAVDPPIHKSYGALRLAPSDRLFVAVAGEEIIGVAELSFETWNGRAHIEHIYVSGPHRGHGVGAALVRALEERARSERSAWCLWLETQNVNVPAIQFYLRQGFRLCGLDDTLYRPGDPALTGAEVALFFTRALPGS